MIILSQKWTISPVDEIYNYSTEHFPYKIVWKNVNRAPFQIKFHAENPNKLQTYTLNYTLNLRFIYS